MLRFSVIPLMTFVLKVCPDVVRRTQLTLLSGPSCHVEEKHLRNKKWVCCRYLHLHKLPPPSDGEAPEHHPVNNKYQFQMEICISSA